MILIKELSLLFSILLLGLNLYAQTQLIRLRGETQGTTYSITYIDEENRNLKLEIDQLLREFDLSVSTYLPHSIISRVNDGEKKVRLDSYFKTCFKTSKKIWRQTSGDFDPTVLPLVNAWGFGPTKKPKLEQEKIDSILAFVGFNKIHIYFNRIHKKDSRIQLDFNAIAQGYSVDLVSELLLKKRIDNFLVEIGGEVRMNGTKENNEKWIVGIEKPIENINDESPYLSIVKLTNASLATSGNYRKYSLINGIKISHFINPKTGKSVESNLLSVTLVASNCKEADAYATALMLMGLDKAKAFSIHHPELDLLLIYSDQTGLITTYQTVGMLKIMQ